MAKRGNKVRGVPPVAQTDPRGNLADRVRLVPRLKRWCIAAGLGALSSCIFAPVEFGVLAWVCLVPVLLFAIKDTKPRGLFGLGYCWGMGHYVLCLSWLKEVFLPAPIGAALVCAFYPAFWLQLCGWLYWNLLRPPGCDLDAQCGDQKPLPPVMSPAKELACTLTMAATWVALEWVRSWLFTGFPWNQFGIALWNWRPLLPLCRYTGVYGLSFLIVLSNASVFLWWRMRSCETIHPKWRRNVPVGFILASALVAGILAIPTPVLDAEPAMMRIGCIQGNVPQIRNQSCEENQRIARQAAQTYATHTIRLATQKPDLIVWPETALPWPLFEADPHRNGQLIEPMRELLNRSKTPMIVGTLDLQGEPGRAPAAEYNSAIHIDAAGKRLAVFDKIHTVPFGEYLPWEDCWPEFLRNMDIFMRSLTSGKESTIFHVGPAKIGINICYEDVFPEISARPVRQGANLLLTITNDAWYRETSGSHQHMTHAIFRAVETMRPMLRNGNNSDTCLIMPDGRIVDPLVDPQTGSPFYRGSRIFNVPVYDDLPVTFYTRHGNLFAYLTALIAVVAVGWCIYRALLRRRHILDCLPQEPVPHVPATEAERENS